jgi:hypothetical protein
MLTDRQILLKLISLIHECDENKAETLLWNDQEQKDFSYFDSDGNLTKFGIDEWIIYLPIIDDVKKIHNRFLGIKEQVNA